MTYKSKHFADGEFFCRCGCGLSRDDVDDAVVEMADLIREAFGDAVRITSSCRCTKHNSTVSSCVNPNKSQHVAIIGKKKAKALDMQPLNMAKFATFRRLCDKLNKNGGVGFYRSFIHIDTRGHRARWRG